MSACCRKPTWFILYTDIQPAIKQVSVNGGNCSSMDFIRNKDVGDGYLVCQGSYHVLGGSRNLVVAREEVIFVGRAINCSRNAIRVRLRAGEDAKSKRYGCHVHHTWHF